MRIQKIRIHGGYKRFHDFTIDLGPKPARFIALVGPNGCGKSSVLDAMLYLQSRYGVVHGDNRNNDRTYHTADSKTSLTHQNIEITFDIGKFEQIRMRRESTNEQQTMFSFRSPYRYNNNVNIKSITAVNPIGDNNYGAADASSLDAKMERSYRLLNARMDEYSRKHDARPSEARKAIIGELNSSLRNCLDLEISDTGDVQSNRGTLYFKKSDQQEEFPFNVLSSGEKEVLDLLLDLYLRQEEYSDTIFLIDEPELHINTSIQGKLLREIDELVGDNCQIWITTHSIGFLRALQLLAEEQCQIVKFEDKMNLATVARVLKPMAKSRSNWKDLFSVALDDLTGLISPRRIVFCEGRAEPTKQGGEQGLDAKVFNQIFSETEPDTVFVSSGGNTELDQRTEIAIRILGKALSELEILLLKDLDLASGKQMSARDRQLYLDSNPDFHRVLMRWEIENFLFDKEVLQAYCVDNDLEFNEEKYDNCVSSIEFENLKDRTGAIKSACGIKFNISPEKFKIALAKFVTPETNSYKDLHQSIFD